MALDGRNQGLSTVPFQAYGESQHPPLHGIDHRVAQKAINTYAELQNKLLAFASDADVFRGRIGKPMRRFLTRVPFLREVRRALNNYRWLRRAHRLNTYAQNGEDVTVLGLFPKNYRGTYIDLGANHPYRISNTYLLYAHGWHGVCVDPMPMFAPMYRRVRPRDIFLNMGVGARAGEFEFFEMSIHELSTFSREIADELVEKKRAKVVAVHAIPTKTLPEIVAHLAPDGMFDVLSIDVEGLDAETVRGTDWASVKPRVVICETSSYDRDWSQQIVSSFSDLGFRHYQHIGCNDVFINTAVGRSPEDV